MWQVRSKTREKGGICVHMEERMLGFTKDFPIKQISIQNIVSNKTTTTAEFANRKCLVSLSTSLSLSMLWNSCPGLDWVSII